MKVFVLPVPDVLQPGSQPFAYPAHNDDYGVEQDFLRWLTEQDSLLTSSAQDADWHYLPVFWTRWHLNHDYGREGIHELAVLVQSALRDDARTFTVCQYDDGPGVPLGAARLFLASRKGEAGEDVPLLASRHRLPVLPRRKVHLASFVGRLATHPVREELARAVAGLPRVLVLDGDHGTKRFVEVTLRSLVALAPRGYGGSSFRFFEAAQMGVVPLLVGDLDTRPFKSSLDWGAASLYAPDGPTAAALLRDVEPADLRQMGARARRLWEEDLTYGRWCRHVLAELDSR